MGQEFGFERNLKAFDDAQRYSLVHPDIKKPQYKPVNDEEKRYKQVLDGLRCREYVSGEQPDNWPLTSGFKYRALLEYINVKHAHFKRLVESKFGITIHDNFFRRATNPKHSEHTLSDYHEAIIKGVTLKYLTGTKLSIDITYFTDVHLSADDLLKCITLEESDKSDSGAVDLEHIIPSDCQDIGHFSQITDLKRQRIEKNLSEYLLKYPVTLLSAPRSSAKRSMIKSFFEFSRTDTTSEFSKCTVIGIDLAKFNNISEVLHDLCKRVIKVDGIRTPKAQAILDNDAVASASDPLFFYSLLRDEFLSDKHYIFVLAGFEPRSLSSNELPMTHVLVQRNWFSLVAGLLEIKSSRGEGFGLNLLLTSSHPTHQIVKDLPVTPKTIYVPHISRRRILDDTKRNLFGSTILSNILSRVDPARLSESQLRLLSILVPPASPKWEATLVTRAIDYIAKMINSGQTNNVIFKLACIELINYVDVDDPNSLTFEDIHNVVQPFVMQFVMLCAYTIDGIRYSSARKIIQCDYKNNQSLSKPFYFGWRDSDLTLRTERPYRPGFIPSYIESALEPEGIHHSFVFSDTVLKQIFVDEYQSMAEKFERKLNIMPSRNGRSAPSEHIAFFYRPINVLKMRLDIAKLALVEIVRLIMGDGYEEEINLWLSDSSKVTHEFIELVIRQIRHDQTLPSHALVLRVTTFCDALLYLADPKLGVDRTPYLSIDIISDDKVLADILSQFLLIELDTYEGKNKDISDDPKSLQYHNISFITYAYVIFRLVLDNNEQFAMSRYIDNGMEIKYALLSRFYQLRPNGAIHTASGESAESVFAVPPDSVIAAFCNTADPLVMTHLVESLAASAIALNNLTIVSHLLMQRRTVRHLNNIVKLNTESRLLNKLPEKLVTGGYTELLEATGSERFECFFNVLWNDFLKTGAYAKFAPSLKGGSMGILSVVKVKYYMLTGQTQLAKIWANYLINVAQEEAYDKYTAHNKVSPLSNRAFKRLLDIESCKIRALLTRGEYEELIELLADDTALMDCYQYDTSEGKCYQLRERYSAILRLMTINHPVMAPASANSVNAVLNRYFNKYKEEVVSRVNEMFLLIETEYEQTTSGEFYAQQSESRVSRSEFLNLAVLMGSKYIFDTEVNVFREQHRQTFRSRNLVDMNDWMSMLPTIRMYCSSPHLDMIYNLGVLRFELYKCLTLEVRPNHDIVSRINYMIAFTDKSLPLYNLMFRILRAEFNRQYLIWESDLKLDEYERYLEKHNRYFTDDVVHIDDLIKRYEVHNRVFELQHLIDYIDYDPRNEPKGKYDYNTAAPWLVM